MNMSYKTLVLLCLGVAAYAVVAYGFLPLGVLVHPDMRASFATHPLGIYTHIFGSAVALVLGPFQFSATLRAGRPDLHRWSGRVYLGVGVLLGGGAGLWMALHAFGGWPGQLGFGLLAAAWLFTGYRAYERIRAGDVAAHQRWMVRNFSLTLAAVTLRFYLPASMASGMRFELAYPAIAWLCWVPNLLVAEIWINRKAKNTQRFSAAPSPAQQYPATAGAAPDQTHRSPARTHRHR
jgi:uncharacterized membrane protein